MPGKKHVKIYSLVKKSYCKVERSLNLNRGGLMGTNTRMQAVFYISSTVYQLKSEKKVQLMEDSFFSNCSAP